MRIDPEYNNYYIYTAVYHNGKQITSGACPIVWKTDLVFHDDHWEKGLIWADANYHLYECSILTDDDSKFIEECIYAALNEADETFGEINLDNTELKVQWCLLEDDQMKIVMNIQD